MTAVVLTVCVFMFGLSSVAYGLTRPVSLTSIALYNAPGDEPVPEASSILTPTQYFEPFFFSEEATTYPSNGSDYDFIENGSYLRGRGPHGGYDTTTNKCGVCHSAHAASNDNLLRSGSTGCEYCHLGSAVASQKSVYRANDGNPYQLNANPANPMNSGHQLGDGMSIPGSSYDGVIDLSCTTCHSVHGARPWKPADFFTSKYPSATPVDEPTTEIGYKLLLNNPLASYEATATGAPTTSPTTVADYTYDPETVNQFTLSYWCSTCHDKAFNTETITRSLETTFTVSTETTSAHMSNVAGLAEGYVHAHPNPMSGVYNGPTQCYTCHRGGLEPAPTGLNPANADENALLTKMPLADDGNGPLYSVNSATDAAKLRCGVCHYGTANYATDTNRLGFADAPVDSDFPHSSINDIAMLGNWTIDASNPYDSQVPNKIAVTQMQITEQNYQRYVCGRCHPTTDGVTFEFSLHQGQHTFNVNSPSWETTGTTGTLGSFFSPGW